MNPKDENFFHQHFEKLLLAVAVLFLAGIGYLYVIGDPFTVDVGAPGMPPGELSPVAIEEAREQAAQKLQQKLQSENAIEASGVKPVIPKYAEAWLTRFNSISSRIEDRIAAMFGAPGITNFSDDDIIIIQKKYYTPTPPMPVIADIGAQFHVLDEGRVNNQQLRLLRGQIGPRVPPDFASVTVIGVFDLDEWRDELVRDHRQEPLIQLKQSMYQDKQFPVGVYLIREELDPATDQWGSRTVIPPTPTGQLFVSTEQRESVANNREAKELLALYEQQTTQQLILQAPMPPLAHGELWTPPGIEVPQQDPDMMNDPNEFDPREFEEVDPRDRRGRRDVRDRRFEADPDEGGFMRGATTPPPTRGRPVNPAIDDGMGDVPPDQPQNIAELMQAAPGTVKFWVHDLSAQPGKTYRYKPIVNVVNPLFGEDVDDEQESENKTKLAIGPSDEDIAKTQWSEPISIPPMIEFFVIDGQENRPAKVQVWKRFDGKWRNETFTVQPGDPIGKDQVQGQIDMRTGAIVVDILSEKEPGVGMSVHRLIYVQDGLMQSRTIKDDRMSEKLKELKEEKRLQDMKDDFDAGRGGF